MTFDVRPKPDPNIPKLSENFDDYVERCGWIRVIEYCGKKVLEMAQKNSLPHIFTDDLKMQLITNHCKINANRENFCKLAFEVSHLTEEEIAELKKFTRPLILYFSDENSPAIVQLEKYLVNEIGLEFNQSTEKFYKPGEHPLH